MDSSSVNPSSAGQYITQINANDVLFGRGSGPNDHEGNIRFRDLVGERKAEYMATNHRQTKAKIAREIVGKVIQKNGRFLKKVEAAEAKELGIPKGVEAWIAVDEETIMEKAKQALRQQRDKTKQGGSKSPRNSPTPASRKPAAAPPTSSLDSYGKPEPTRYGAEISAESLRQSEHMQNVEAELAGYAHATHLHPNPYEPIPIGSHAVLGSKGGINLDWRHYTQAAIMAQTQGHRQQAFPHQPEPIPQHTVSNVQSFPRPMGERFQGDNASDRRESIQVTDLMDSFNKMKTRGFDTPFESAGTIGTASSRGHESIDTIETIEPLPVGPGNRDPSTLSMSSGNFSAVMKGLLQDSSRATETALLKGILEDPFDPSLHAASTSKASVSKPGRRDSSRQSINIEDKDFFRKGAFKGVAGSGSDFSNMSMSFSQVWSQKSPGNLGNLAEGDEGRLGSNMKTSAGPRQVVLMDDDPDNMSGLGKSSMSILNVAMGESQGESIMTANESIFSDIGD